MVANDEAANDNTQKMALKMAVPGGIKSLIKPVDEAIRILNNPKASRMRILVLTRTVKDALKIRQSVGEIGFLNVGNTGRFDGIDVSEACPDPDDHADKSRAAGIKRAGSS